MCISAATALALSAAATAAGTGMNYMQQQKSMKRYNNEVSAQNRLLSDQFADRQKKINEAKTQQGRVFGEISAAQDAEFEKQKQLAQQKQQLFQDTAADPNIGADAPAFQDAVARRGQLFADTDNGMPADYNVAGDSMENRVLQSLAEKSTAKEKERTGGIVNAQSRMAALQDQQQNQGMLFRDLVTGMGDIAKDANASSNLLSAKLRTPEYRMGALGAAMGEQANSPYFRGTEPVYRTPNTLFSDILSGAGQLGSLYAFRQPAAKAAT